MSSLCGSAFGAAWDFVPSALEYQGWPQYCRVQYTTVNDGLPMYDGPTYSAADVAYWRGVIGDPAFTGLHHYCASIHIMARARGERDPRMREFTLNRALDDALYSYTRSSPTSIVYPNMAIVVAQIKTELGKAGEVPEILSHAIKAQPQRTEPYVALAVYYRKQRKNDLALETLQKADEATGGESVEVKYNLGLINLELGNVDAALENAKFAYSRGYPLPGLQRRLEQMGRWKD